MRIPIIVAFALLFLVALENASLAPLVAVQPKRNFVVDNASAAVQLLGPSLPPSQLISFRYVPPNNSPYVSQELPPQVTLIQGGVPHTYQLQTYWTSFYVDNNTVWNTTNPWFFNDAFWLPSPPNGLVTSSGANITITYASQPVCTSSNAFTLLVQGCLWSVYYYTWVNTLGSFGFGLMFAAVDIALYHKTENVWLGGIIPMVLEGAVFGILLPQFFLPLSAIFLSVALAASVYNVVRDR
jgi:hypothetical protein